MKTLKKSIAVLLAVLMIATAFSVVSFAADDSVTAKFLNYNVAGLPNINHLLGKGGRDVSSMQSNLGKQLNASDYDVIAVQEDFTYHKLLVANMNNYTYKTKHSGGVPGGDGLNVYTKNSPIYDATRTPWNVIYGTIEEGDTLTPKGILYTVLDMGNGIYVDFYDLHADAFDGGENALSRADEYKQLIDLVNKNSADRPVIITGDFNTSLHITNSGDNAADEVAMYDVIKTEGGFKDAWIELKNNGDYDNFSGWSGEYWGKWDSVEKFYYRDGKDIKISAADFNYVDFYKDGEYISDHSAAECTFTFTKTADFTADSRAHKVVTPSDSTILFNTIKWIFKDLVQVFKNWSEIKGYIGL